MSQRLISPNRRRIVSLGDNGEAFERDLRKLGWVDYVGPAQTTAALAKALHGWIIPGADPAVDEIRTKIGADIGTRD
jgi:hypothetical protein